MKKIGLALGGGGARGLAHIPMLEVFDELGIRPYRIAGTSIGAVVGALYASGLSGAEIRDGVRGMLMAKGESLRKALRRKDTFKWIKFLDLEFGHGGLFKGDKFIDFLYEAMSVSRFAELQIPLQVVTTDFYSAEQVVIESGELLDAIKASMALPGLFTPVQRDGRVLIDGGSVNPVPFDLLADCDMVVAINVMGELRQTPHKMPSLFRVVLGTFDIMQKSIITEKLKSDPPDVYITPDILNIDILEFYKAEEIYAQAQPACRKLKRILEQLSAGITPLPSGSF
ncbi:MAG: patatin-like phospholipase family protein [bacterium]